MAKKKAPDMDDKAANFGDRLKHALLLETMERTRAWPSVVYAETHAGAGVYHAGDQTEDGFINDLRQRVEKTDVGVSGAGTAYLTWLKEWWSDPANRDSYPGSALTALRWLKAHRPRDTFQLHVTEKDSGTCARLRQSLGSHGFGAKEQSFIKELHWLTADDGLILLIDPFGCATSFEGTATGRGFDDGWIDHATVQEILSRFVNKERAIVSFWWGFGQALRNYHEPTCRLLAEWAHQQTNAMCRIFHDKRNHANALIGVGGGAEIVRALPGRQEWKGSWLADSMYERINN